MIIISYNVPHLYVQAPRGKTIRYHPSEKDFFEGQRIETQGFGFGWFAAFGTLRITTQVIPSADELAITQRTRCVTVSRNHLARGNPRGIEAALSAHELRLHVYWGVFAETNTFTTVVVTGNTVKNSTRCEAKGFHWIILFDNNIKNFIFYIILHMLLYN